MNDFDYDHLEDLDETSPFYDEMYAADRGENLWYDDEVTENVGVAEFVRLCVQPTINDGFSHVSILLLWCFLFRLSTQLVQLPQCIGHLISAGTGAMVLHHFFRSTMYYVVGFVVGAYALLYVVSVVVKKHRGPIIGISSVLFLIGCELSLVSKSEWHKIRGAQMLVAMKVISIAFDTDFGALRCVPSPLEFSGYALCVGTCVFGPWVPYRDYVAIFDKPLWNLKWLWQMTKSILLAFIYLSVSTCWIHWLIPDGAWRWWIAYRDALSFRSSHYFVSLVSETSAILSGFGRQDHVSWSLPVAKPRFVEMPRSLVQVVVCWNLPMHNWLKNYVFRTVRPWGSLPAIACTYMISSLLHGLNFQLAAVLLSLGAYTYVEYILRQKLAAVFGACILARPCKKDCSHPNKEKRFLVVIANLCLAAITMFHLSYLGVMFDASSKLQEQGYDYTHTLSKWSVLSFASHWLCLGTYIFYLLI